jgi:hypothetical protein
LNVIVQKREAIVSYAGRQCCLKEFHNSKTKKAKENFPMDKSKPIKTKYKDVGQEEVVAHGGYPAQPLLCKG